jgi:uncharacterized protein
MRRDEVIATLRRAEPALRSQGVGALYLFGSVARDEATPASDVDVFVDPITDAQFGFIQFMHAYDTIRRAFGQDVDIGYSTRDGLSRYLREEVEHEAIKVF